MTKYRVKEEYIDDWYGGNLTEKEIERAQSDGIDMDEIKRLVIGWTQDNDINSTLMEIMEQLEEI